MTFGALPAGQAWLLIAAAGGLAAWLFLRRLRPPRILVSSLLVWQRVLDEPRELTLWERIRRAVSFVLTVVIALVLALAIARPSPRSGDAASSRGRVLIVLDSSWSMLARTSSHETRWQRAVGQARRLAAAAAGGSPTALATTADGLVEGPTTDLTRLEAALDRIAPAGGDPTAWPELAGADSVHFITDGAAPRILQPGITVHSVFEAAPNVGVTAFDVRASPSPDLAGTAYLEIVNYADAPQDMHVTITRGDAVVLDRRAAMRAGEALRQLVPLGRGGDPRMRVHVDAPHDALDIDDDAFAWIEHANPVTITVVGQQTAWLRPLFAGDPDVRVTFIDPSKYGLPASAGGGREGSPARADVLLFDRWAPDEPPTTPAIYVAPTDVPWLTRRSDTVGRAWNPADEQRPRWEAAGSHPVVDGVDPLTMKIEKAHPYAGDTLMPVAQSAKGTPLVYVADTHDRRFVVLTFGPGESNLASAPGFPVLMGNALDWLVRPDAHAARTTGRASFSASTARLTGPGNRQIPLSRIDGAAVAMLREPGLYVAEGAGATSTVAVNVGDPQISNLSRTNLSRSDKARPVLAGVSGRPWWMYCAAAAFALALVEWWTWQRRITV
ncbi:MAG: hypothetical protein V7647_1470 [Acidobacteriota bacterium]